MKLILWTFLTWGTDDHRAAHLKNNAILSRLTLPAILLFYLFYSSTSPSFHSPFFYLSIYLSPLLQTIPREFSPYIQTDPHIEQLAHQQINIVVMGKGGRVLCIITPYALTIASLVCIIIVGLGCTNSGSSTLNDLYFFRVSIYPCLVQSGTSTNNILGRSPKHDNNRNKPKHNIPGSLRCRCDRFRWRYLRGLGAGPEAV